MKKIALGSDHAGYELKEHIKNTLIETGYDVIDFGTDSEVSVDYPYFGLEVAKAVSAGDADAGILFCGTGIGMTVVANKVKGIRAALVTDIYTAIQSRKHNNSNILALGGRVTGKGLAEEIVKVWLTTPFEGGRHEKRLERITEWENEHLR